MISPLARAAMFDRMFLYAGPLHASLCVWCYMRFVFFYFVVLFLANEIEDRTVRLKVNEWRCNSGDRVQRRERKEKK